MAVPTAAGVHEAVVETGGCVAVASEAVAAAALQLEEVVVVERDMGINYLVYYWPCFSSESSNVWNKYWIFLLLFLLVKLECFGCLFVVKFYGMNLKVGIP